MYCPTCGQQQTSEETRFCSRCGFLLTGIYEIMANGGVLPNSSIVSNKRNSPRNRGLKQGLFIFLLSFLVVPIIAIGTIAAGAEPYLVAISAILLFVGGLLRAAYALMFESNEPLELPASEHNPAQFAPPMFGSRTGAGSLPPQQSIPTSAYAPPARGWRETNDLISPPSVTDSTTRHLQKDES